MPPIKPTFSYERALMDRGVVYIAGVDEVGVGCLAGPVVAAAVILPLDSGIGLIRDSKTLSELQRNSIVDEIKNAAHAWAIGEASVEEIDRINIRNAANLAMQRAIEALKTPPEHVLIDGNPIKDFPYNNTAVIKGDRLVKSIAAASIIAKVYRDDLMTKLAEIYPGYGLEKHAGYGTPAHLQALRELGSTAIHRMSFAPCRAAKRSVHRASTFAPTEA
jgi:ribonuclease HII